MTERDIEEGERERVTNGCRDGRRTKKREEQRAGGRLGRTRTCIHV